MTLKRNAVFEDLKIEKNGISIEELPFIEKINLRGDTKDRDRQDIVEKFQDKNSPLKYFVGNPSTGGYGLTLTAAHTVVYYSNTYDLEKRMQSEDRAHRIGQVNKVTYIDMIAEGTIDEKIVRSLRSKIDIASEVMGEQVKEWVIEPIKKRKDN